VVLRGMGRLDIFPGDDVGAQSNLQRRFHRDTKPGYDEIKELVSRWSPYPGLVYFHLLLGKLRMKGVLQRPPSTPSATQPDPLETSSRC
jgi:DNA-3-methyladenine glycosylase II